AQRATELLHPASLLLCPQLYTSPTGRDPRGSALSEEASPARGRGGGGRGRRLAVRLLELLDGPVEGGERLALRLEVAVALRRTQIGDRLLDRLGRRRDLRARRTLRRGACGWARPGVGLGRCARRGLAR